MGSTMTVYDAGWRNSDMKNGDGPSQTSFKPKPRYIHTEGRVEPENEAAIHIDTELRLAR